MMGVLRKDPCFYVQRVILTVITLRTLETSSRAPEHSFTLCGLRVGELPNPILARE